MQVVPLIPPTEEKADEITFDTFWTLYPRHVAKKDARLAWSRINAAAHVEILTALAAWRTVWIARGELQYVPYPATWLNGERWEDELPKEFTARAQAHQPLPPREETKRAPMPEHVRALIAKLRTK